jgi:hypothetical protein
MKPYPLITRDPITDEELVVTRIENKYRGLVLEGAFSFGWIGRLNHEQLEFAGLLLRHRGNVQKLADVIGVSYNTARSRLDAIVDALGGGEADTASPTPPSSDAGDEVLGRLERGEIDFNAAMKLLKR